MIGFGLLGLFYLALAGVHARVFALLLFVAAVGGLGNGLFGPALSACYLDITREQYRSVVAGIEGPASSLGGVAGPFLVAVLSPVLGARGVFVGSAALAALAAVLALVALRFARRATVAQDELISGRLRWSPPACAASPQPPRPPAAPPGGAPPDAWQAASRSPARVTYSSRLVIIAFQCFKIEKCPSSGRKKKRAAGSSVRRCSPACLGTFRSCPPCQISVRTRISLRSNPQFCSWTASS